MPSCQQAWPCVDQLHAATSSASHAEADSACEYRQHCGYPNTKYYTVIIRYHFIYHHTDLSLHHSKAPTDQNDVKLQH